MAVLVLDPGSDPSVEAGVTRPESVECLEVGLPPDPLTDQTRHSYYRSRHHRRSMLTPHRTDGPVRRRKHKCGG